MVTKNRTPDFCLKARMDKPQTVDVIDPATFDEILLEYSDAVPEKLSELDKQRYVIIPEIIKKQKDSRFLSKQQVATLVDWKL